jgi:hypothetical protein
MHALIFHRELYEIKMDLSKEAPMLDIFFVLRQSRDGSTFGGLQATR